MTLVEVMLGAFVFLIAVLGMLAMASFSLRNADAVRVEAQATQILLHEMESMRARSWLDRSGAWGALHGIKTLGTGFSANGAGNTRPLIPGGQFTQSSPFQLSALYASANARSTFTPFMLYGRNATTGSFLSLTNWSTGAAPVLRGSYTCSRLVTLSRTPLAAASALSAATEVDKAVCQLSVAWTRQGVTHTRTLEGAFYKNALNAVISDGALPIHAITP